MKRRFRNFYPLLALGFALSAQITTVLAQNSGPAAPGYPGGSVVHAGGPVTQNMPPFPASPLAGGTPAAQGGAYMDAHGQPVILPVQYSAPYAGGYSGPMMGGYGDPMAVDFGGYAGEQVGPHYFDVYFGTVWLDQEQGFFDGLPPFTERVFLSGDLEIDPATQFGEYEPGWEIAVRYDIGPLAVVEATYMGIYDIGFADSALGTQDPNTGVPARDLNSFFSGSDFADYGDPNRFVPGIDQATTHNFHYEADLQSTALSYRRYWVAHNPSISGTWLLGARYIRFTDRARFSGDGVVDTTVTIQVDDPNSSHPDDTIDQDIDVESNAGRLAWEGENDLVGFQFGGDAWICLRQGLRLGGEGVVGIYNNRYKYAATGEFDFIDPNDPAMTGTDNIFDPRRVDGNQVAFATEASVSVVADILSSWSLRGGYRVVYMSSLATAANNIQQDLFSEDVFTQQSLLFHGFHGSLEYIW